MRERPVRHDRVALSVRAEARHDLDGIRDPTRNGGHHAKQHRVMAAKDDGAADRTREERMPDFAHRLMYGRETLGANVLREGRDDIRVPKDDAPIHLVTPACGLIRRAGETGRTVDGYFLIRPSKVDVDPGACEFGERSLLRARFAIFRRCDNERHVIAGARALLEYVRYGRPRKRLRLNEDDMGAALREQSRFESEGIGLSGCKRAAR